MGKLLSEKHQGAEVDIERMVVERRRGMAETNWDHWMQATLT
jgi:hypothetical protein